MTYGKLAFAQLNIKYPLQILKSGAGFYIGTADESGSISRESVDYYPSAEVAAQALDGNAWTQRSNT
ncbi:MAG TPA: hypothetical protein DEH10_05090 [Pseudomonas sp.]|nr:hypothetical protein [Pseudomonas sp.]|tara:strand:+ start:453 stop:653 length:201 start_codon:yes stop_codon:yes gene_type:complete